MYRLSRTDVDLGCTLARLLLRHRIATGTFSRDPDAYRIELLAAIRKARRRTKSSKRRTGASSRSSTSRWRAAAGSPPTRTSPSGGAAEKELDRTRKFLDMVIENVPVTVLVKDAREQRYVLINRAGEEFFGVPARRDDREERLTIFCPRPRPTRSPPATGPCCSRETS